MDIKQEEKKIAPETAPKVSAKDLEKNAQAQKEEKIEKDIERNFQIRTMPKKYKTIAAVDGQKGTRIVGVVIIFLGFLTMVALIVAAYLYFIKPQTELGLSVKEPIVVKKTETEEKSVSEKKAETTIPKTIEKDNGKEELLEEEEQELKIIIEEATTTPTKEASSTIEEIASTTSENEEDNIVLIKPDDTDNDGLFDKEELILGSDSSSPDSDQDGYDDLKEVLGLYNPINTDKLYANPGINTYRNEYLKYTLLYPKAWRMSVVGDNDSVVFAVGDGSFINLIAQPNIDHKDIVSWVNELLPKADAREDNVVEGENWRGLFHENQRIFYLTDNNFENIFIFDYSPVSEDSMDYYNIFQVMIKSFVIEE